MIAGDGAGGFDGVEQFPAVGQGVFFEEGEDGGGGAALQRAGEGGGVGVAEEEVQAAEAAVVGEGLVARVDEGAVELDPLVDVVDDVVGALGDLVFDGGAAGGGGDAAGLPVEGGAVGFADATGAGVDLAGGEEGEEGGDVGFVEFGGALDEVVFVAAEGGAGVVVDVVFDEGDAVGGAEILKGGLDEGVAGGVVGGEVGEGEALRGGVFEVPHVEVEAATVAQEAAVAGGLLVVAVMEVEHAGGPAAEEVGLDPHGPGVGAAGGALVGDEAAVFGFKAGDAHGGS